MILLFGFSVLLLVAAAYLYITKDDGANAQQLKKYERLDKVVAGLDVEIHRTRSEIKSLNDEVIILRDMLSKQGDKLAWAEMKLNNLPKSTTQKLDVTQLQPLKMVVTHRVLPAKRKVKPEQPSVEGKVVDSIKTKLKELSQ